MLENTLPTRAQALALVRQHLPEVLAADGHQCTDWQRAQLLSGIARQQLRHHFRRGPAAPAADTVLRTLTHLDARLEHPGPVHDWPFAQTQLGRIMPLVERLLLAA